LPAPPSRSDNGTRTRVRSPGNRAAGHSDPCEAITAGPFAARFAGWRLGAGRDVKVRQQHDRGHGSDEVWGVSSAASDREQPVPASRHLPGAVDLFSRCDRGCSGREAGVLWWPRLRGRSPGTGW
jgi:hypothetical protein